jgi:KaiC/GvpD/RAD55 family RecA-like ATPase
MKSTELNAHSPMRVLERCTGGGLGSGNIGVVMARHGVGKTAFLVDVALDSLLRGRQVLHVSLQHDVEKVRAYYDEIFADLAHKRQLEDVWKVRYEMEKNRRIHSFLNGSFSAERFRDALAFKKNHMGFSPSLIVMDGYEFSAATPEHLPEFKRIAKTLGCEFWFTAVTHREAEVDARGIPQPVAPLAAGIDVILKMAHDGQHVHISILKDHDNPKPPVLQLALDPTTMLIIQE